MTTAQVKREGEDKMWLGPNSVADNINKIRKATQAISINGKRNETDRLLYRFWLMKNTDGPSGAKVWAKSDFEKGQMFTKYSQYDKSSYKDIMDSFPVVRNKGKNA